MTTSPSRVHRHFVTVGERQVHYRRAGEGPVVVMLHISPLSSRTFVPVMERLADRYTLIAIDRPGYGSSDPLSCEAPGVADYAAALRETFDALGIERALLYARATGTPIATEFARRNPDRVTGLVMENMAMIGEDQRALLIERFAPSFAPEWDGSHLLRAWSWWRNFNVFWPWFDRGVATRQGVDIPAPDSIHEDVLDLLRSGQGYHRAPDAVFRYDPLPALAELKAPMTVFARAPRGGSGGSSIEWLDRLMQHAPSVEVERYSTEPLNMAHQLDPETPEHAAYISKLRELFERFPTSGDGPPVVEAARIDGRLSRAYVATPDGQILLRQAANGEGRPLVLLHDVPRSSGALAELALALAPNRPVFAPDLPGFGESDRLKGADRSIAGYASAVSALLDGLRLEEVDVYGAGAGGVIANELTARDPRIKSLILDQTPLFSTDEGDLLAGCDTAPLEPSWDGTHLVRAWARVQDSTLFWPWCNRTREGIRWEEPETPAALHERTIELLKGTSEDGPAQRATLAYPLVERLRGVGTRTLIAFRPGSGERFERLAQELGPGGGHTSVRPFDDLADSVRAFTSFLDGG